MSRDRLLAAAPLMAAPVLVYNAYAALLPGGLQSEIAHRRLTEPLFQMATTAGAVWPVSASDLLLAGSLLTLFVELIKPTSTRRIALVNRVLSTLLFVICVVEMLVAPACATSTFFLVALMALLDVMAGVIVAARPDGSQDA